MSLNQIGHIWTIFRHDMHNINFGSFYKAKFDLAGRDPKFDLGVLFFWVKHHQMGPTKRFWGSRNFSQNLHPYWNEHTSWDCVLIENNCVQINLKYMSSKTGDNNTGWNGWSQTAWIWRSGEEGGMFCLLFFVVAENILFYEEFVFCLFLESFSGRGEEGGGEGGQRG